MSLAATLPFFLNVLTVASLGAPPAAAAAGDGTSESTSLSASEASDERADGKRGKGNETGHDRARWAGHTLTCRRLLGGKGWRAAVQLHLALQLVRARLRVVRAQRFRRGRVLVERRELGKGFKRERARV